MEAWEPGKKASLKQDCRRKGWKKGQLVTHTGSLLLFLSLKTSSHFTALPHCGWEAGHSLRKPGRRIKLNCGSYLGGAICCPWWSIRGGLVYNSCIYTNTFESLKVPSAADTHLRQWSTMLVTWAGIDWLNRLSFYGPSWPWPHSNPPASASQVLMISVNSYVWPGLPWPGHDPLSNCLS